MIRKERYLQALRAGGILLGAGLIMAGCADAGTMGDGPRRDLRPVVPFDLTSLDDLSLGGGDDASAGSDDASVTADDAGGTAGDAGGPADDSSATPTDDASRSVADAPPAPGGDGGAGGCISIATWPGLKPLGGYDPQNVVTYVASIDQTAAPFNALGIEDFHAMGVNYPKKVTYTSSDNYAGCDVCTLIQACTAQACNNKYFAQAGSVTVTRADQNDIKGRMTATASNLKLVEWDFMVDKAIANGKCYLIGSASFDVTWDKSGDGGTSSDGGTTSDGPALMPDLSGPMKDGAAGDMGVVNGCTPLINEVMTTGIKASEEFVEIFNPCAAAVDMTGWKLNYRSQNNNNNGAADSTLFTFASKISAGGYLVIGGNSWTGPSDGTFGTGGLAEVGGAVGLRDAGGRLVDSMSYNALLVKNNFTQTAPAPHPPKSNSVSRLPNGTSTGDNSKDFKVSKKLTPKAANQ